MTELGTGTQSPFILRYAGSIAGVGVGFVTTLALFLGKTKVPGFSALIDLYPSALQDWLIPVSGIFMAMMASSAEFIAYKKTGDFTITLWFKRTVSVFVMSFLLLLAVYTFTVVRVGHLVPRAQGEPPEFITLAVITGSRTVPQQVPGSDCTCHAGWPAGRCVEEISLHPQNIDACFGSNWVAFVTLVLVVLYLGVIGSFAATVALGLLRKLNSPPSSEV